MSNKITLPDILYLNTNNKPSYVCGLYQSKDGKSLEMPNNSIYMQSAYETQFPYADKFISIIRDNMGQYHLVNHNLFVYAKDKDFKKEKTNFIYQDTSPLITYSEWLNVVKNFKISDKKRYNIYIKIFEKNKNWSFLFNKDTKKISYNQAFQLYRFLEICSDKEFKEFTSDFKYTLSRNGDWNWSKWNTNLAEINKKFATFQDKLIYTNFIKNLNYYKLKSKININMLHIIIGRIDPHYGGVISINYCHPNKYIDFMKDYMKFKNKNIISLKNGEIPNILNLPDTTFTVFSKNTLNSFNNKYVDQNNKKNSKKQFFTEENFGKTHSDFCNFITSTKNPKMDVKVIIIGSNNNGIQYTNSIKNLHNKNKKNKTKTKTT